MYIYETKKSRALKTGEEKRGSLRLKVLVKKEDPGKGAKRTVRILLEESG